MFSVFLQLATTVVARKTPRDYRDEEVAAVKRFIAANGKELSDSLTKVEIIGLVGKTMSVPLGSLVLSKLTKTMLSEADDIKSYTRGEDQTEFVTIPSGGVDAMIFDEVALPMLQEYLTKRYSDIVDYLDCIKLNNEDIAKRAKEAKAAAEAAAIAAEAVATEAAPEATPADAEPVATTTPVTLLTSEQMCNSQLNEIKYIQSPPFPGGLSDNNITGEYERIIRTAIPDCLFGTSEHDITQLQNIYTQTRPVNGRTFNDLRNEQLNQSTLLAFDETTNKWVAQREETCLDPFRHAFISDEALSSLYPNLKQCRDRDLITLKLFNLVNALDMKSLIKMMSLQIVVWVKQVDELATDIRFDIPFVAKQTQADKDLEKSLEVAATAPAAAVPAAPAAPAVSTTANAVAPAADASTPIDAVAVSSSTAEVSTSAPSPSSIQDLAIGNKKDYHSAKTEWISKEARRIRYPNAKEETPAEETPITAPMEIEAENEVLG
jgi:hypothetical protein